jgi:hypothetical protein
VNKRLHWDDVLALGYAAEQLFLASQLLTSDVVPIGEAVHTACHRHIGALLSVRRLLPGDLVKKLDACAMQCQVNGNLGHEQAKDLANRVLGILDDLRRVLNDVAQHEGGERLQSAA